VKYLEWIRDLKSKLKNKSMKVEALKNAIIDFNTQEEADLEEKENEIDSEGE
jgi:hypothetical protein